MEASARPIFTPLTERRSTITDYEKGTPSWDISHILTRHANAVPPFCARAQSLRNTAMTGTTKEDRLKYALETPCTCGMGDSDGERTSIIRAERIQAAKDLAALEAEGLIKGKSDI